MGFMNKKYGRSNEPRYSPYSQPETKDNRMPSDREDNYSDDNDDIWENELMLDCMTTPKRCTSLSDTKSAVVFQPRQVNRKPVVFKIKNIMYYLYGNRRIIANNNVRVVSPTTAKAITPVPSLALSHLHSFPNKLLPTLYFGHDSTQQQDKPVVTGLTSIKVVQYGLAGIAIGLGGYIVYKVYVRK